MKIANGQEKVMHHLIMMTVVIMAGLFFVHNAFSLPASPTINYIDNSTSTTAGVGQLRSGDDGGYITTLNLNALQQNQKWKAYVGNVTGRFILEDSDGFSIYEWNMALSSEGKIFIARNGSVQWATVDCANRSIIETEDTNLSMGSGSDNINNTFNSTIHKTFNIAGVPIANSTCPSIATYVNDTAQVLNESAAFQEILLADNNGNGNLIYVSILEQDSLGYNNVSTFDFQAIVADDETGGVKTPYYFYVELGI